jgi:uncharacterized membrane protein YuzA (DUF378 family)
MKYEEIAEWLLLVGGLNLGLSLFNINVIKMITDATAPIVSTIVYAAVGISAVYTIYKKYK